MVTTTPVAPDELTIRPLTTETWDAFADLAERHDGVWGGCWCTWFHPFESERRTPSTATEGKNHCVMTRTVAPEGKSAH